MVLCLESSLPWSSDIRISSFLHCGSCSFHSSGLSARFHLLFPSHYMHWVGVCEWWLGAQNQDWEQRNLDSPPRFNRPPKFKASSLYLSMPCFALSNINLILFCLPTQWTLVKLWASQRKMQQEMHFSVKEINGKLKTSHFQNVSLSEILSIRFLWCI